MKLCEKHRAVGNNLFHEGSYIRAAEQFKTSLSYYEYCFPDGEEDTLKLDRLRHTCLCNIALCYVRAGRFRAAVDSADQIIREGGLQQLRAKAYYLRGCAHRDLYDYAQALSDLAVSLELDQGNRGITSEMANVKALQAGSKIAERLAFGKIFASGGGDL